MIGLTGQIALALALFVSLLQGVLPLWGYARNNRYLLAIARPSAIAQCAFVAGAYILLTFAFLMNDFSIAYVAANSHPALPFMYRLTAVWGAHEGSILFWVLILNVWAMAYAYTQKDHTSQPLVLAVMGLISFCFLCFLMLTSSPFVAAVQKLSGNDLNPLLQDPGFVIHPPMLYMGYVGFSAVFAITQAALIRNKLDATYAKTARQFAVAAWCFLTLGITLGSWWAYRVLGWGGFWFWDPVENASLLPWLAGTALIHVLLLLEKRQTAAAWVALLATITFALSVLGTFLVRSGVLISAHTFANDPARGVFLLLLLGLLTTASLALYLKRLPQLTNSKQSDHAFFSRDTMLMLNSGLLFTAMLTILLGTLYPLMMDALKLGTISVGAPYFNKVMLPFILLIMLWMGFGPYTNWQTAPTRSIWLQIIKKSLISVIAAGALLWYFTGTISLIAFLSLSLSFWIITSITSSLRTRTGMSLAHLGFAILVIGVMLSSLLSQEQEVRIKPGDSVNVGPYEFLFISTEGIAGSNYRGIRADFDVIKNMRHITNLYPEKRIYTVRDMVMTKVDINPGIFRDLYIALGEPLNQDEWSVRVYYKPFIRWIWFGGAIMMIGGILTILPRRRLLHDSAA
jgi:cytochrome c-type biogenesis protein CcmF